ncbi:MAG: metal-dependent transcriptional regulator [Thermoprotei archaeon]|nr:metal-dependent transcriptional regulator [TACK group archaeon]
MSVQSDEDYLLAVYELIDSWGSARLADVCKIIGVAPSSAMQKLDRMTSQGILLKNGRGNYELTESGMRLALKAVRKHRLAERLLTDVLGLGWAEAHEESRLIEHAIDERIAKAIEGKTGAVTCPHGNPIPSSTGSVEGQQDFPLDSLSGKVVVSRVSYEEFETLYVLEAMGIRPGTKLQVDVEKDAVLLHLTDGTRRVSKALAHVLRGRPLEEMAA